MPVAHWPLDSIDSNNGVAYNVAAHGLHLRTHGNPRVEYEDGRNAVWLDGGDYFSLRSPKKYMNGVFNGFTIAFWYNQLHPRPSHYEPFILLYKDSDNFVSVTDHWSDHRVDVKTSTHQWVATTGPRNKGDRWLHHCTAVFRPDRVRLVLSQNSMGDIDDRTQSHDLSRIDYQNFEHV